MLDEILLGLSATILLRMSHPNTSSRFPEVNKTISKRYELPDGDFNEVFFKHALRQVNFNMDTINVKTSCNLTRVDDLYYEFHVVFKDLIRDFLHDSERTICADLMKFDVVHSVQAIQELVSLLERILQFLKYQKNYRELGDPKEVYEDIVLLNSIVNIAHSVIYYNNLPYRNFPDVITYLNKIKSRKIKEIVTKNREIINEKYAVINKEHEQLASSTNDPNLLRLILFNFFYK